MYLRHNRDKAREADYECASQKIEPGDTVKFVRMPKSYKSGPNAKELQESWKKNKGQTGIAQNNWGRFGNDGTVKLQNGETPWLSAEDVELVKKGSGPVKEPREKKPPQGKFKDGTKVKLLPFEGEPAQTGRILGWEPGSKVYMVQVDKKYLEPGDDGLREVPPKQLKAM